MLIGNSSLTNGYGQTVDYKCNEGYIPVGNATRECQSTDEWTQLSCARELSYIKFRSRLLTCF